MGLARADPSRFFLSYRREDSAGHAGRLLDHLVERFGRGSVFVDVDSIEAGMDFADAIEDAIAGADAVLVVIGAGWLTSVGADGGRRLEEPSDWVRREIETALVSGVRVIPVLVGGAAMPTEEHLPESIAGLARRNAVELQDRRWRQDVDALVDALEGHDPDSLGNLPTQATHFFGRGRELAELTEQIQRPDVRLISITGPGGTGKTRMALQAASMVAQAYPGGVWFIDLTSLSDPELMLPEVARVLDLRDIGEALIDAIVERVSRARTLMVLDNLEQLLPQAAVSIALLLSASSSLDLMVTTRQRLHITAEREFPVGTLDDEAAVDLFLERARSFGGGLNIDDESQRQAVAAVCARLDGLPLAIELAASRTRLLDPEAMLARLDDRLSLLTGGARDLPPRQQTIRATIDWSYELLSPMDQTLFARLSIFAGGWTLTAAEALCADGPESIDVLDGLESLERNSLIQRQGLAASLRFRQLETVREYASELLRTSGEYERLSTRHAEFFLGQAEAIHAELLGPRAGSWFERFEPELGNFRSALQRSLAEGRVSFALRLTAALMAFLQPCGCVQEAQALGLEDVLARSEQIRTPDRPRVLVAAGSLLLFVGRLDSAQALLEDAVEVARQVGDPRILATAMSRLGWARAAQGQDDERTVALGEDAVSAARTLDDPWVLAETLNDLSCSYGELGGSPRAVSAGLESLRLRRSMGYLPGVADSLINLSWLMVLEEDYPTAVVYLRESLDVASGIFQRWHAIIARGNLAFAHLLNEEPDAAAGLFRETLLLCREIGDRRTSQEALIGLAGVAAQLEDWNRAAWLAGAAMTQLEELNIAPGLDPRVRARFLPKVREALGDRYDPEYQRGTAASFEDAVSFALGEVGSSQANLL